MRLRRNRELSEEIQTHMRMAIEDRVHNGESRQEAEQAVRREFGNEQLVKEVTRDIWGWTSFERLLQDVTFGLRILRRNPGFTAVAIITLALGIGANTAIFSVINGLLIRSLPFPNAKELVWVTNSDGSGGPSAVTSRMFTFRDLRQYNHSFSDMAGYNAFFQYSAYNLNGVGEPERLSGVDVTETFFSVLGVQPALGRFFLPDECQRGGRRTVILSNGFWKARFAQNPQVLGQTLTINGQPRVIIGVLPATFNFSSIFVPAAKADIFVPYYVDKERDNDGNEVAIVGRLKPGVTVGAAQSEMRGIIAEIARRLGPRYYPPGTHARLLEDYVTGNLRRPLIVLGCAVGFVLLIACANLSNLLLARASVRRREIALRLAIGASRFRLVRQMVTESIILSLFGGLLGLPLAFLGTHVLAGLQRTSIPLLGQIQIDLRVFLFTLALAVITGTIFGLMPAFAASGADVNDALKEGSAGAGGAIHRNWTRSALIVSEIALSLVLLGGAGLMIRSFIRLLQTDLGFRPDHVAIVRIDPVMRDEKQLIAFLDRVTDAVRAIPGIEAAGITDAVPLDRDRSWGAALPGQTGAPGQFIPAFVRVVGPGYFSTLRVPVLEGRAFDNRDALNSPKTVIINETMARKLFAGQNPVGRMVFAGGKRQIIAVVRDVKHSALDEEAGSEFYIPYSQGGIEGGDLVIRTTMEPEALASALRRTIWAFAPNQPLREFRTADQLVETASSPRRFTMLLLGIFAGLALMLAAVGIYGVIAYSVGQRTREMGIRMALGANPRMLEWQVVKEAMLLSVVGASIGLLGLGALSRYIASLLFGTSPADPLVFTAATAILIGVASIAAWIPARHAARIDPVSALRFE
jgi:putative ABC transport system permease protein